MYNNMPGERKKTICNPHMRSNKCVFFFLSFQLCRLWICYCCCYHCCSCCFYAKQKVEWGELVSFSPKLILSYPPPPCRSLSLSLYVIRLYCCWCVFFYVAIVVVVVVIFAVVIVVILIVWWLLLLLVLLVFSQSTAEMASIAKWIEKKKKKKKMCKKGRKETTASSENLMQTSIRKYE